MNSSKNSVSPDVKLKSEQQNLKLLNNYALEIAVSGSYSEIQAITQSVKLCRGRILNLQQTFDLWILLVYPSLALLTEMWTYESSLNSSGPDTAKHDTDLSWNHLARWVQAT